VNGNVAAVVIAAVMCIAALTGWVVISERLDRPRAGRHDPFADPADRTDPDGAGYVGQLLEPPAGTDDFWERHAPRPAAAGGLARGTGQFPMLPPDPEPDPTLIQPADVIYLGKPSGEYVDDLFSKHAPEGADEMAARYLT
jgi:hypothetical protein